MDNAADRIYLNIENKNLVAVMKPSTNRASRNGHRTGYDSRMDWH